MPQKGFEHIPSNHFSLHDHVLDMAVAVGAVPERYRAIGDPLARCYPTPDRCGELSVQRGPSVRGTSMGTLR